MESQEGSLREESQGNLSGGSGSGKEAQGGSGAGSAASAESGGGGSARSADALGSAPSAGNVEEFTPETKPELEDPYGEEPDETLSERLWGLTEMFPEYVRNATYSVAMTTKASIRTFYGFSRSAFWVVFSSSIILFAPVIFEVERVQMEEAQRTQQKQMLLGPNTAVSGGMPLMPPIHRQ